MGWRIVQITKPCKLSVKNSQFVYEPFEDDKITLPLEDISVIILDNKQILLSNSLLSELLEYGIVLFTDNSSHIPSGAMCPFHNHSRYSEIAWQQVETTEPLKKRIWQEIIKQKIINQGTILNVLNKQNGNKLLEISKQVLSGDTKNTEAFAANIYWKSLFDNFNRQNEEDIRNSALNYGYAILRGCMARSVVGAGLLPCFGVHHANKLNQFNLVDDLLEPLRPFIDYKVHQLDFADNKSLTALLKNQILSELTENCILGGEEINLLKACELISFSIAKAIKNKNPTCVELPNFLKKNI